MHEILQILHGEFTCQSQLTGEVKLGFKPNYSININAKKHDAFTATLLLRLYGRGIFCRRCRVVNLIPSVTKTNVD
ncbi:hypothetical protein TNCV_3403271 [Trichonephila clavipes]|nr:hypothetical protein TNCV_3403271 [Trichonephila clavipes]